MKKTVLLLCMAVLLLFGLSGCKKTAELQDGYYTARMDGYSNGWQEFVTICVRNGEVITTEYNATAPSGFIKSWDISYMRIMNPLQGTYPNNYTRRYAASFLNSQSPEQIDIITGASSSGENFKLLTAALLEKAKEGDTSVAVVPYPTN